MLDPPAATAGAGFTGTERVSTGHSPAATANDRQTPGEHSRTRPTPGPSWNTRRPRA